MSVFVVFGRRSATLLYILYIVGGGRARRTARPGGGQNFERRNVE